MKKTRSLQRKIYRVLIGLLLFVFLLLFINFIPAFQLETKGMSVYEGEWIDVYYENEKEAAADVFEYAEKNVPLISEKFGFTTKQNVKVYIYDSQKTMQQKKYGLIGRLLGLKWYIGDNIGTNVILTSPANPGLVHTYEDNKSAVLHEIVHAYISVINPDVHLWLTEGCALYLANGDAFSVEILQKASIPSYGDTLSRNPIRFSNCGGYIFAHTYIEYLDKTYGWDKVLQIIKTEDYVDVLGKTQQEIYDEWIRYIRNYNAWK